MSVYYYMRISTAEERGKQKFDRQEKALAKWAEEAGAKWDNHNIYKDDASGSTFDRPEWKSLTDDPDKVKAGDTIVFKDFSRFTRADVDIGYAEYMKLFNRGINLVFVDNPTVSTEYIKHLYRVADNQDNKIVGVAIGNTVKLLIYVELDRAERERLNISKRIRDGISASPKKSGRKVGSLVKLTPELERDIIDYLLQGRNGETKQNDILKKHKLSRNTLKKYIDLVAESDKYKAAQAAELRRQELYQSVNIGLDDLKQAQR